jgi:hypothetical protein
MAEYGILLVDTSWTNHDTVVINKSSALHHKARLVAGTKALIYVREPIDAVIAEAEVTGDIIETESEAIVNASVAGNTRLEGATVATDAAAPPVALHETRDLEHSYRVPLKIVRLKGRTPEIPLNRLRAVLGSEFSVFDETWIPLSKAQYQAVTALWAKE